MSEPILAHFFHAARSITGADRGLVVDADLQLVQTANLEPSVVASREFIDFANRVLQDAINEGAPMITNNVITDPAQAPTTNTNFANLRVIVAIPVTGHGAIYLEKHISKGVIARETIEKLMRLAEVAVNDSQTHNEESLVEKFAAME